MKPHEPKRSSNNPLCPVRYQVPLVIVSASLLCVLFTACAEPRSTAQGDHLAPLDVADFNRQIRLGDSKRESWVKDPLQVALRFAASEAKALENWEFDTRQITLAFDKETLSVMIHTEGLRDDSIGAEKKVLQLRKEMGGTWYLNNASWGQRCQQGRGHTNYSAEPCF